MQESNHHSISSKPLSRAHFPRDSRICLFLLPLDIVQFTNKPKPAIRVQLAVSDFEKRMSEVLYISLCVSVLSVCPPCLCLRGLRLCAPYPPWPRGCSGLLQSCHFPKCLEQDCCNPVTSRSVWLRIAAILSLPEVFGSGLLQSCHFPKSLEQDCCNPVTSRSVWLRIAAILSLPEEFGAGLLQSCRFPKSLEQDCCNLVTSRRVWSRIAAILRFRKCLGSAFPKSCFFQPGNARCLGKAGERPAGSARCLGKGLSFRLSAEGLAGSGGTGGSQGGTGGGGNSGTLTVPAGNTEQQSCFRVRNE